MEDGEAMVVLLKRNRTSPEACPYLQYRVEGKGFWGRGNGK
jgi:hypothetical protein